MVLPAVWVKKKKKKKKNVFSITIPLQSCFPRMSTLPVLEKHILQKVLEEHPELQGPNDSIQVARLVSSATYKECVRVFNDIFAELSSDKTKEIAKQNVIRTDSEFAANKLSAKVYGEVEFFSFANLLERMEVKQGDKFFDLGHGTGKAMVVASLLFGDKFSCIEGVELLEDLHGLSEKTVSAYQTFLANDNMFVDRRGCPLVVSQGDFLCEPWTEHWTSSDIVFANSTCFDDDLMQRIAIIAERMKSGARMITFTQCLPSTAPFQVIERVNLGMSWGCATCFIHVRQ